MRPDRTLRHIIPIILAATILVACSREAAYITPAPSVSPASTTAPAVSSPPPTMTVGPGLSPTAPPDVPTVAAPTVLPTAIPAAPPTLAAAPPSPANPQDATEVRTRVVTEAARQANVPADQVEVLAVEPREWADTSLGCPEPGNSYAQVVTPGFLVLVRVQGVIAEFHADGERVVRCD